MKSASQFFLGLLTAVGSSAIILAAAALALLEGGAGVLSAPPNTATPTVPVASPPSAPLNGVTPSPNASPRTATPTHVIIMQPSATQVSTCPDVPKDWPAYIVQDGDTV